MTHRSKDKEETPTSLLLGKELRTELDVEAKRQDLRRSQLIRRILDQWLSFRKGNKGNLA